MSEDMSSAPAELPVLVGPGRGEGERLLLLGAPSGGRVVVREWSVENGSGADDAREMEAAALLEWFEAQAAAGRTLNQSLYGIRLWLRGEGIAPRSR